MSACPRQAATANLSKGQVALYVALAWGFKLCSELQEVMLLISVFLVCFIYRHVSMCQDVWLQLDTWLAHGTSAKLGHLEYAGQHASLRLCLSLFRCGVTAR